MIVRCFVESSSAIFSTVFKPGLLFILASPTNLILAGRQFFGGRSLKDRLLLRELPPPGPFLKEPCLLSPSPSSLLFVTSCVQLKPWRWLLNSSRNFDRVEMRLLTITSPSHTSLQLSVSIVREGGNMKMVSMHLSNSCLLSYLPVYLLLHVIAMYSTCIFYLDIYAPTIQTFLVINLR